MWHGRRHQGNWIFRIFPHRQYRNKESALNCDVSPEAQAAKYDLLILPKNNNRRSFRHLLYVTITVARWSDSPCVQECVSVIMRAGTCCTDSAQGHFSVEGTWGSSTLNLHMQQSAIICIQASAQQRIQQTTTQRAGECSTVLPMLTKTKKKRKERRMWPKCD